MEIKEDNSLPFLYILLSRKEGSSLAHQLYRKKTHTDKYIWSYSHHHQAQKIDVINTLTIIGKRIYDLAHLDLELEHLVKVFKNNGNKENLIKKTMKRSQEVSMERNQNEIIKSINIPYIQGTTNKIANILRKK